MSNDEVAQATLEGKELEYRGVDSDEWKRFSFSQDVNFFFNEREYRIKPQPRKPREWWMNPYNYVCYGSRREAFLTSGKTGDPIHVREVEYLHGSK